MQTKGQHNLPSPYVLLPKMFFLQINIVSSCPPGGVLMTPSLPQDFKPLTPSDSFINQDKWGDGAP